MVAATYSSLHDCPIWLYRLISRTRFRVNLHSTILPEYQNPLLKTFGQTGPTIELCWKCWFVWCIWLYCLVISRTRFRVNPNSLAAWMLKNSLLEIQPFNQTGQMIGLCCEYLSVWCTWLYVFAMSRSLFRVNTVQTFYFYSYFYLFKNDLVNLRTPRNWGWHFIKKINTVLHKMLKLGFQHFTAIFLKNTFLVATFFLYLGYLFELIFALLTFADKGITFMVSAKFPMASKFNFSQ